MLNLKLLYILPLLAILACGGQDPLSASRPNGSPETVVTQDFLVQYSPWCTAGPGNIKVFVTADGVAHWHGTFDSSNPKDGRSGCEGTGDIVWENITGPSTATGPWTMQEQALTFKDPCVPRTTVPSTLVLFNGTPNPYPYPTLHDEAINWYWTSCSQQIASCDPDTDPSCPVGGGCIGPNCAPQ